MRGNLLNACLYIHHHMFVENKTFTRAELAQILEVSPRQVTRYISEINSFLSNNYMYEHIMYCRRLSIYHIERN